MDRGAMAGYSPWGCEEIDMTEHACRGEGRVISNSPFGEQFNSLQQNVKCPNQAAQWPENLPAGAGDAGDTGSIPGSGGGMAAHSSILAWEIPWTEEPGGQQSVGLKRVRHN